MLKVCPRIVCNYACLHTEALLRVKVWKPFVAWGWAGGTERASVKQLQTHEERWQRGPLTADWGNVKTQVCVELSCFLYSGHKCKHIDDKIKGPSWFGRWGSWTFVQPGLFGGLCGSWLSPQTVNYKQNSSHGVHHKNVFWEPLTIHSFADCVIVVQNWSGQHNKFHTKSGDCHVCVMCWIGTV